MRRQRSALFPRPAMQARVQVATGQEARLRGHRAVPGVSDGPLAPALRGRWGKCFGFAKTVRTLKAAADAVKPWLVAWSVTWSGVKASPEICSEFLARLRRAFLPPLGMGTQAATGLLKDRSTPSWQSTRLCCSSRIPIQAQLEKRWVKQRHTDSAGDSPGRGCNIQYSPDELDMLF